MNNLFIMRISPSTNKLKKLVLFEDKIQMITLVSENIIKYVSDNKYIFKIIVDGNDHYFNLNVSNIYQKYAEIIYINSKSNALSFKKQIDIALENNYEYIEFAEDDYLKFGNIEFSKLNSNIIYTGYNHPDYSKVSRKIVSLFSNGNLGTLTFSFLISQELLRKIRKLLLYFDRLSDGLIFYSLTLNNFFFQLYVYKYCIVNRSSVKLLLIRSLRRKFNLNKENIHIQLLPNIVWIHLAKDSLVKKYENMLLNINKLNFVIFSKKNYFDI